MAGKVMHNGHFVGDFRWHGRSGFEALERSFAASIDAARKLRENAEALKADPHLTGTGQRARLLEAAAREPAMAIGAARKATREAREAVAERRRKLAGEGPDKTDLAGALMRGEIRSWLRGMDTAKRTAMLAVPAELDPVVAIAIVEAPAALAGVTREQRERLMEAAIDAANPGAAAELAELEEAAEIAANAESHLARTVSELTGLGSQEVQALAHRDDPPKLKRYSMPGGALVVMVDDASTPTGRRMATPAELAVGVFDK